MQVNSAASGSSLQAAIGGLQALHDLQHKRTRDFACNACLQTAAGPVRVRNSMWNPSDRVELYVCATCRCRYDLSIATASAGDTL